MIDRIGEWLRTLTEGAMVEVRYREEVVDSIKLDSHIESIAIELDGAAESDANDRGRTCVYQLVAILPDGQRYVCPLRIRKRVNRQETDIIQTLAKLSKELIENSRKERNDLNRMMLHFCETLQHDRDKLVNEVDKHRTRASEVIDKIEVLRSKEAERAIELKRQEKHDEIQDRLADAAIPLTMAIANRLTAGKLPGANMKDVMLCQIAKSMSEDQLTQLEGILGDRWPQLSTILANALENVADVNGFIHFARSLDNRETMAVIQCLNMGQQAALQELLQYDGGQNGTSAN